jgi:hypothetical protein
MNHFWSATSSLVNIYFVSLILIGSYFALNLVLVRAGRSGVLLCAVVGCCVLFLAVVCLCARVLGRVLCLMLVCVWSL